LKIVLTLVAAAASKSIMNDCGFNECLFLAIKGHRPSVNKHFIHAYLINLLYIILLVTYLQVMLCCQVKIKKRRWFEDWILYLALKWAIWVVILAHSFEAALHELRWRWFDRALFSYSPPPSLSLSLSLSLPCFLFGPPFPSSRPFVLGKDHNAEKIMLSAVIEPLISRWLPDALPNEEWRFNG
jgi:hypothetical protein